MSITRILYHHNLLANVLKYIINDCIGIYEVCKILNIHRSEYLAQCYVDLHSDLTHNCTGNKCCTRYQLRYALHKCNPTELFNNAWNDYCQVRLMLYAARNGADFMEVDNCVLNLFGITYPQTDTQCILEIFTILMSKGNLYLYKFARRWLSNGNNKFPLKDMLKLPFTTDESKEMVTILYGDAMNPLIHYWLNFDLFIQKRCLDFIPREQMEPFVSPDEKYLLTVTRKINNTGEIEYAWELYTLNDLSILPINLDKILQFIHPYETHVEWVGKYQIKFRSFESEGKELFRLWIYDVNTDEWDERLSSGRSRDFATWNSHKY